MTKLGKFIETIFIIFYFVEINGDSLTALTRYRRQIEEDCFKCSVSGECIAADKECDGVVDCRDGSDENDCSKIRCPPFAFRCNYGACIMKSLTCNGKADCRDGSDELTADCGTSASTCKDNQFQCKSGQCIPDENKCDGVAQCKDNSDETLEACKSTKCRGFAYQCAYGACVVGDAECNGFKDCFDNSDEDPKKCGTEVVTPPTVVTPTPTPTPPPPPGSCVLPPHPARGEWNLFGNTNLQPGDSVGPGSVILLKCNKGYAYRGTTTVLCTEQGTWNVPIGVCEKLCQAVSNRTSTSVICTKEFTLGDCAHPDEGTRAEFTCEPFYENRDSTSTLRICHDGSWDKPKLTCEPICGLKTGRAETLIIGGNNATEGDYPWHVALYYNQVSPPKYLCGGSLISQNVIISAAHCVTDVKTGNLLSKNLFTIAVGKYYRKYNDERDRDAQFSELEQIYIMRSWRGETLLYQADIAILITKKVIQLSRRVQPVCMDFDGRVIQSVLQKPNPIGVVVGFGATKEVGSASEVLKEITLPYIPSDQCEAILPEEFRPYLNYDKFCSGYVNKSSAVCTGDSGGGLVFQSPRNNRYYLAGIVSLSPKSDSSGCDQNLYSLFTNVTQFVKEIIVRSVLHPVSV